VVDASSGEGLSSLVSIASIGRQHGGWPTHANGPSRSPVLAFCEGTEPRVWWSPDTGEIHPWRCKRNRCARCGPINAHLVAGAIALAEPERLVTLTRVGDDWQTIRSRVRDLSYDVRRSGRDWNVAWSVEPNPKGTGHHVHALHYGAFVPQRTLSRLSDAAGLGPVVDIRRVTRRLEASRYGLKLAASAYGVKMADGELESYLRCNGGRVIHTSRGFWRDGPGRPIRSTRGAVQLAVRRAFGDSGARRWTLITHQDARERGLVA